MTDPKTALQNLAARGITTLEQFVARKAQMRELQRIDSEKALQDILVRSAPPNPLVKSNIGPPAPSVAIVLDVKRVDYNAIARLNGQPLDYVATTLKGGEQALVIFSDRSIMKNHRLRQFQRSFQAIGQEVVKALMSGGLQPSSTIAAGIGLGVRFFLDTYYEGDYRFVPPNYFVSDLSELDTGLGGDWSISSILMRGC